MGIRFSIPYPGGKGRKASFCRRFGLNAYYAGKHWSKRKADAEEWHWQVLQELGSQGIRREIIRGPAEVTFRWNDGLDCDNHAVMGKFIVDAIKGYLITDDDRRYITRVTHEFHDGEEIEVEITAACSEKTT